MRPSVFCFYTCESCCVAALFFLVSHGCSLPPRIHALNSAHDLLKYRFRSLASRHWMLAPSHNSLSLLPPLRIWIRCRITSLFTPAMIRSPVLYLLVFCPPCFNCRSRNL